MAVSGRKPKPDGQAIHRNKLAHDWTEVPDLPFKSVRKLPARRMNGRLWQPRIRAKWKTWSSMPHCVLWTPATWEFALDTIEIAALVYDGETRFAPEVRAREKTLGTTPESLRDLRIRYVDAPKPEKKSSAQAAGVTNLADFRVL